MHLLTEMQWLASTVQVQFGTTFWLVVMHLLPAVISSFLSCIELRDLLFARDCRHIWRAWWLGRALDLFLVWIYFWLGFWGGEHSSRWRKVRLSAVVMICYKRWARVATLFHGAGESFEEAMQLDTHVMPNCSVEGRIVEAKETLESFCNPESCICRRLMVCLCCSLLCSDRSGEVLLYRATQKAHFIDVW